MRVLLVTGNQSKVAEVRDALEPYGVNVEKADLRKFEVQGEIEEVSMLAARLAAMEALEPVVVDDSGLYVEALKGFPGPYSSYVYSTIGNEGLLSLLNHDDNRAAAFRCAVSYVDPINRVERTFLGEVMGYIRREPGKPGGFGFDPIFSPFGPNGVPLSEMSIEEKNAISHRGKAFRKLGEYLAARQ
ncbi:RdgB/HAM1 family non-canonical purine NTP pyrophosphatase [Tardisphaera saccharovorans]|nr:RdgB/HAM1 family non-canonical purine NTP pyrophosphatase [TACK group archaeon]